MRNHFFVSIVILVLVLVQESFLLEFFGSYLNPSLVIALAYGLLLTDDESLALYSGFFGGLMLDMVGVGLVGLSSLVLVVLLLVAIFIRKTVFRGFGYQLLMIVLTNVIYVLVLNFPNLGFSSGLLFSGALSGLIALAFSLVVRRMRKRYLSSEYRIRA